MATARHKTRDPFTGGLPRLPDVSPRPSQGFGLAQKHPPTGKPHPPPPQNINKTFNYSYLITVKCFVFKDTLFS